MQGGAAELRLAEKMMIDNFGHSTSLRRASHRGTNFDVVDDEATCTNMDNLVRSLVPFFLPCFLISSRYMYLLNHLF
jgi:hypothetical protein